VGKLVGAQQVKNKKGDGNDAIVDAVFKKRILRGRQKSKMPAEQYERGNIPAHDEHTNGHTHDGRADGIGIAEVFGRQEEGIGAIAFHEGTVDDAEHEYPKDQQHLVFPEMKKDQL
jgi:hypothetical protein